jgi:hypothetical protein
MIDGSYSVVSLVSIGPEGAQDRSARDALALAQDGLSPLLALEIASTGRSATDKDGAAHAASRGQRTGVNFASLNRKSKPMSSAGALWVSQSTEIKSTPVAADGGSHF